MRRSTRPLAAVSFRAPLCAAVLLLPLLAACTGVGHRAVPRDQFNYNEAIARTRNQQLLLNLVRLRYRDTPFFLETTSVSTQFSFGGSASAGATVDVDGGSGTEKALGLGVSYTESPTVTYAPLTGEAFVKRLLSPVPLESLLLLSDAGWGIDRLLRCCVQSANDLWNAPSAAGPTPDSAPEFEPFLEMARAARELQRAGALRVVVREDGTLLLRIAERPGVEEPARALRSALGVSAGLRDVPLTYQRAERTADGLALTPRSLTSTLYFLSQGVEPPQRDVDAGRVTRTLRADGAPFDWSEVTGELFRVRSGDAAPADAFVRVRYRGSWFWIDDDDLSSKSTFGLVQQLFGLQAGSSNAGGPLLTLPLSR